jgi:hypothetical protein
VTERTHARTRRALHHLKITPHPKSSSTTAELRHRQAEVPEGPGLLMCCLPTNGGGGAAGRRLRKTLARSASAKAALTVAAKYDDLGQLEWQEPVRLAIRLVVCVCASWGGGVCVCAQVEKKSCRFHAKKTQQRLCKTQQQQQQQQHAWSKSERASSRGGGTASSASGAAAAVKTVFDAHWAGCALPPTRAGRRCELALELELAGYCRVVLPLVTKVYGAKEAAAARHGVTCNGVVYTLARSSITGEVKCVAVHYAK